MSPPALPPTLPNIVVIKPAPIFDAYLRSEPIKKLDKDDDGDDDDNNDNDDDDDNAEKDVKHDVDDDDTDVDDDTLRRQKKKKRELFEEALEAAPMMLSSSSTKALPPPPFSFLRPNLPQSKSLDLLGDEISAMPLTEAFPLLPPKPGVDWNDDDDNDNDEDDDDENEDDEDEDEFSGCGGIFDDGFEIVDDVVGSKELTRSLRGRRGSGRGSEKGGGGRGRGEARGGEGGGGRCKSPTPSVGKRVMGSILKWTHYWNKRSICAGELRNIVSLIL